MISAEGTKLFGDWNFVSLLLQLLFAVHFYFVVEIKYSALFWKTCVGRSYLGV
jgi:hypothetical protein